MDVIARDCSGGSAEEACLGSCWLCSRSCTGPAKSVGSHSTQEGFQGLGGKGAQQRETNILGGKGDQGEPCRRKDMACLELECHVVDREAMSPQWRMEVFVPRPPSLVDLPPRSPQSHISAIQGHQESYSESKWPESWLPAENQLSISACEWLLC